ncbi:hypothetical protein TRVL_08761 [Trypanosoma vivax]|nr:hypothetical protein TRVL_08761 [Trypanosoma vivax]
MRRIICSLATQLVALIVVIINWYQWDKEVEGYIEHKAVLCEFMSSALHEAPASYDDIKGKYVFGRTTRPQFFSMLHRYNVIQAYTQKKEFVWIGISARPWFIGFAVLQFGYVSVFCIQLYNTVTRESWKAKTTVPLFGWLFGGKWVSNVHGSVGPTAEGHSVDFSAPFTGQSAKIRFVGGGLEFDVSGTVKKVEGLPSRKPTLAARYELSGSAQLPKEFLGLVFPLGPRRAAVVHKFSAVPLSRPLSVGIGEGVWHGMGHISMDYTRGLLRRDTRWCWCTATAPEGYGFHLSAGTYDIGGKSMENSFYANGKVALLNTAVGFRKVFEKMVKAEEENIDISSGDTLRWAVTGDGIDLQFACVDSHNGTVHCGVVDGNLNHSWGIFNGTITVNGIVYEFSDVPGALEQHNMRW